MRTCAALRPGDEVLGRFEGSFAEYARAEADLVVPKPARLTFEQAAAVTMAGQTALRAIRDVGQVRAGHRVLINGAAGGVGSFAVQIATALGAEVTGVCSTAQRRARPLDRRRPRHRLHPGGLHRRARALRRDPGQRGQPAAASPAPGADPDRDPRVQRRRRTRGRVFGPIGGDPRVLAVNGFVRQRLRPLPDKWTANTCSPSPSSSRPGSSHPSSTGPSALADTAAGLRYLEEGHARGKVVITVT